MILLLLILPCALSVTITGYSHVNVTLNEENTTLTIGKVQTSTHDEVTFGETNQTYKIGPAWSFFRIDPRTNYTISQWQAGYHCSDDFLECKLDYCNKGPNCGFSNYDGTRLPTQRPHYCWWVEKTGSSRQYAVYGITKTATIALFEYGGPGIPPAEPGYTITDQILPTNYNFSTVIEGVHLQQTIDLEAFRFLEHSQQIIYADLVKDVDLPPFVEFHREQSRCWDLGVLFFLTVSSKFNHTLIKPSISSAMQFADFRMFLFLDPPAEKLNILEYLEEREILTKDGLRPWKNTETFEYLDICSRQFLILRKSDNKFYVRAPGNQALSEKKMCIGVRHYNENGKKNHLHLYEAGNLTNFWKWSKNFRGFISDDFVSFMDLRITTKSSLTFKLETADIVPRFDLDEETPYFELKTDKPLKCLVHLSQDCKILMTTYSNKLVARFDKLDTCGHLMAVCYYECSPGGHSAQFIPPEQLVKKNASELYENVVIPSGKSETESFDNSSHTNNEKPSINWTVILGIIGIVIVTVSCCVTCVYCNDKETCLGKMGACLGAFCGRCWVCLTPRELPVENKQHAGQEGVELTRKRGKTHKQLNEEYYD